MLQTVVLILISNLPKGDFTQHSLHVVVLLNCFVLYHAVYYSCTVSCTLTSAVLSYR